MKKILLLIGIAMGCIQMTNCSQNRYSGPDAKGRPLIPWCPSPNNNEIMNQWYENPKNNPERISPKFHSDDSNNFLYAQYDGGYFAIRTTYSELSCIAQQFSWAGRCSSSSFDITLLVKQLSFSAQQQNIDSLRFSAGILLALSKFKDPDLNVIDRIIASSEFHKAEIIKQIMACIYHDDHKNNINERLKNITIQSSSPSSSYSRSYLAIGGIFAAGLLLFISIYKDKITNLRLFT